MKTKLTYSIIAGLACVWPAAAEVNVQVQGSGLRYTGVLVNGSSTKKYDLVFVGDGFTAAQQSVFNDRVDDAVAALEALEPYASTMCGFNVWRVNVISSQSGVDHPADDVFRNTELDCRYGDPADGEAERCITSDSPADCQEAAGHAPDADAVFVLVNDTQWGGCAGDVVFSSIAPGFAGIITHELGHKMGGLADEYECYVCDGSDDDRTYGGAAPSAVNLTTETVRTQIPWSTLILPSTPLPTTVDSPAGVTGLWEGGGYFAHGIFRPQRTCHMRESGPGFCSVCNAHMSRELRWHCTACELDPDGFACLYGDLLKRWQFLYEEPVRIRWPIPPCLSCPFDAGLGLDTVLVILGMPDTADLKIFDDAGEFVTSTDGPVKRIAQVSFVARADRQYFAELSSGPNDQPTGAMVELSVQLFRGDVEQELPEGP